MSTTSVPGHILGVPIGNDDPNRLPFNNTHYVSICSFRTRIAASVPFGRRGSSNRLADARDSVYEWLPENVKDSLQMPDIDAAEQPKNVRFFS
ncbi:hypothetical protein CDL15_Pgr005358 [Punica granatum]|uniref:Uncharacterized protein n=1 Tax=Punica granatum TaxID=22663 RepID=A0A218XDT0_PUNGR|nr:hypothetical protein CDL15_Pgr005358 [Punica granatum]